MLAMAARREKGEALEDPEFLARQSRTLTLNQ
jgi:hypothetical protein